MKLLSHEPFNIYAHWHQARQHYLDHHKPQRASSEVLFSLGDGSPDALVGVGEKGKKDGTEDHGNDL
ncbi:hypothetical protein MRX96_022983 [Rhipicephalus microplus]